MRPTIQKVLNNLNQVNLLCTVTSKIKWKLIGTTINPLQSGSNDSNFCKYRKYQVKLFFIWWQCLYDHNFEF